MKKVFLCLIFISIFLLNACGSGNGSSVEAGDTTKPATEKQVTSVVSDRTIMVEAKNGSVEAYDGKEKVSVVEGDKLISGQEVTTGLESDITLLLDADKHVYAAEKTVFKLVALGKSNATRTRIDLVKGTLVSGIDNKLGSGETFTVTTPNAAMSVRGTVFTTKVTFSKGEYVTELTVTDGAIETTTIEDGSEKKVTVSAGETKEFSGQAPEIELEPEEIEEAKIKEEEYRQRFSKYESDPGKETINFPKPDSEGTVETDCVVISGTIWEFSEYYKEECENYMAQGYGVGHTGAVFVADEPITMLDGMTLQVFDLSIHTNEYVNWENIPFRKHGKFYGYFAPCTLAEAWNKDDNGNTWVNLDTIIIGKDWWYFDLMDFEAD